MNNEQTKPKFPPADAPYSEVQKWYRAHDPEAASGTTIATVTSIRSASMKRGIYWREKDKGSNPTAIEGPIWSVDAEHVRIHTGTPRGITFHRADFERNFAPVPLSELRLYYDGSDTVIAYSPADASAVWAEHIGEAHSDARHPWREWGSDPISFFDAADDLCSGTPEEMIAEYGRWFLCSEDR